MNIEILSLKRVSVISSFLKAKILQYEQNILVYLATTCSRQLHSQTTKDMYSLKITSITIKTPLSMI